jgi:2-polyprenyl-3-methyl-5-hydroxy-6-metoxy-1,4-benzoquinol methylase
MATNYPKMVTHFPKPKMVQRSLSLSRIWSLSLSRARCLTTNIPRNSSVDQEEMKRFSRVAQEWWNPSGPYSVLYRMNPVRVGYIRNTLDQLNLDEDGKILSEASATFPLKGMNILDVGCGGGFLSHSLSRLGTKASNFF